MGSEVLSLRWNDHKDGMISVLNDLLCNNNLVDCTIAAEGQCLKAHKIVLSASSPYFKLMFNQDIDKHPIVFLKDVKFNELKAIIDFVYRGEVKIKESQLNDFLEVANSLQIRGLNGIVKNTESQKMIPPVLPVGQSKRKRKNSQTCVSEDDYCESMPLPVNFKSVENLGQHCQENSCNFSLESLPVACTSQLEPCNFPPNVRSEFLGDASIVKEEPMFNVLEPEFIGVSVSDDFAEMNCSEYPSEGVPESLNQQFQSEHTSIGAKSPSLKLLSDKSRKTYEKEFEAFKKWREANNVEFINEDVVLEYFQLKAKLVKAPSLWSYYSMLKATLRVKENIDISHFCSVTAFVKQCSTGYKPKESKCFTRNDLVKFLNEASDEEFLLLKVAMIIGVAGGCRIDELIDLTVDDVEDRTSVIIVRIPHTKSHKGRVFMIVEENGIKTLEIIRKYVALRPPNIEHKRFFISYRERMCTVQPVGKNTFGKMPMLIAKFLKLPNEELYTGHCFRRSAGSFLTDLGIYIKEH